MRQKTLVYNPPKPKVPDPVKAEVEAKAMDLIKTALKPKHIKPHPRIRNGTISLTSTPSGIVTLQEIFNIFFWVIRTKWVTWQILSNFVLLPRATNSLPSKQCSPPTRHTKAQLVREREDTKESFFMENRERLILHKSQAFGYMMPRMGPERFLFTGTSR